MASRETTQADCVERSLKRLGFRMTRVGRTFTIIDSAGEPTVGSKTECRSRRSSSRSASTSSQKRRG
jgi:hypothetical protein